MFFRDFSIFSDVTVATAIAASAATVMVAAATAAAVATVALQYFVCPLSRKFFTARRYPRNDSQYIPRWALPSVCRQLLVYNLRKSMTCLQEA